jgi:RNA-directed DNA polymerase
VRRQGGLLHRIADRANLLLAWSKACRGHRAAASVRAFAANLEANIAALRQGILAGTIAVGACTRFEIRDPKPRAISAPAFPERVLHHAIFNVCGDRIERYLSDDSYACRPGKGTIAAVARAQRLARAFRFVLKLDVRKYFDNIDHAILLDRLGRLFKDRGVLSLLARIIDSHHVSPGKGLPIGTLVSQHCANLYLGPLDHHARQGLRCGGYVRYMDDFLLFDDERTRLRRWLRELRAWMAKHLRLELKPTELLVPTVRGCPFLGFRVLPDHLLLTGARKRRFCRSVRRQARIFAAGLISERKFAARLESLFAHAAWARTHGLRAALLHQLAADGMLDAG